MPPTKEILVERCKELRKNATDAEQVLWKVLRNRQLLGIKFRRQYLFQRYILDLYAPELKLAIELDGGQHLTQVGYDQERTECLEKEGILVIRFWNDAVLKHLEDVIGVVWEEVVRRREGL
jgi:adenine-specific DNA-methyltransferase